MMMRPRHLLRFPPLPAMRRQSVATVVAAPVARLVYPLPTTSPATETTRRKSLLSLSPRLLSFVAVVMLPVVVAAAYLFLIAADQYVAEFRLTLRSADAPSIDPLSLFRGDVWHSSTATESQVVAQYIGSRAIVDALDPSLDLRRMFSLPQADWWARLTLPASIEDLVFYWEKQVDPFYDTATGTIIVRVRAFTADDSVHLAQAIVAASEKLINDLSARARRDAVATAGDEVVRAEARLKSTLAKIREFRDREGLIDPGKTADATAMLATKLRDDLLKTNSDLATLRAYMNEAAPVVQVLKARIRALEAQERGLGHEMTASSVSSGDTQGKALSSSLGSYEQLDADRKFAETAYQHTLEELDRARDNADRQHIYIASFVPPGLPETSLYPRRWRSLGVVALIAFAVWVIGTLTVQSVRDHL
jgi:capsular polysaccharide transport system permease protein